MITTNNPVLQKYKGEILNYEQALIVHFLIISCSSIGEGSASGKGVFSTSGASKIPIKIGSRSRSRYEFVLGFEFY